MPAKQIHTQEKPRIPSSQASGFPYFHFIPSLKRRNSTDIAVIVHMLANIVGALESLMLALKLLNLAQRDGSGVPEDPV